MQFSLCALDEENIVLIRPVQLITGQIYNVFETISYA